MKVRVPAPAVARRLPDLRMWCPPRLTILHWMAAASRAIPGLAVQVAVVQRLAEVAMAGA